MTYEYVGIDFGFENPTPEQLEKFVKDIIESAKNLGCNNVLIAD
jgi:hypothetical protein